MYVNGNSCVSYQMGPLPALHCRFPKSIKKMSFQILAQQFRLLEHCMCEQFYQFICSSWLSWAWSFLKFYRPVLPCILAPLIHLATMTPDKFIHHMTFSSAVCQRTIICNPIGLSLALLFWLCIYLTQLYTNASFTLKIVLITPNIVFTFIKLWWNKNCPHVKLCKSDKKKKLIIDLNLFIVVSLLFCLYSRPQSLTLQAVSEEDRRLWLDAMDGKEPVSFFLFG